MQVLNSSVARPWKLEQNTSGQASRQASRASRLWKLEQNNMTKKGPFFGPQNVRKSRRAKMGLPSSRFQPQLLLVKSASTWKRCFNKFDNEGVKKGPKLEIWGGTTFDFKRVHFLTLFETRFFCTGVQNWTLSRLNPVPPWRSGFKPTHAPSSAALFQCRNTSTSHKPTSSWQQGPRTREAPTPSPKIISVSGAKNEPQN